MQPHSCAALTVFTYLHGDLVMAMREEKNLEPKEFRFSKFDVRVETPSYRQKIYRVEIENFSRSQSMLKLRIGQDYPCHLEIKEIDYNAEKCKFVHSHDTRAYSEEVFTLVPYSNRFTANYRVPIPIRYGEIIHDVSGDILGSMHLQIHNSFDKDQKKPVFSPLELTIYDTRTNETDPVRRREFKYHTWVLLAY